MTVGKEKPKPYVKPDYDKQFPVVGERWFVREYRKGWFDSEFSEQILDKPLGEINFETEDSMMFWLDSHEPTSNNHFFKYGRQVGREFKTVVIHWFDTP